MDTGKILPSRFCDNVASVDIQLFSACEISTSKGEILSSEWFRDYWFPAQVESLSMRYAGWSTLIMLLVNACTGPAPSQIPIPGSAAWWVEEYQRQEIVARYCNPQHSNPECAKAQAAWQKWQSDRLRSEMQAEHQRGFAYYAVAYGLGSFVGAPPPGIEGPTMKYDNYARTMSYGDHDDYVSPLSR